MTTGTEGRGDYIARPMVEGERCGHGRLACEPCEDCAGNCSGANEMSIDKARATLKQIEEAQDQFRAIEDQYLADNYGAPDVVEDVSHDLQRLRGWAWGKVYDLERATKARLEVARG